MIKIEIKDATVNTRSGKARATGRDYTIRSQEGYAHTVSRNGNLNAYPEKISITLEDGQSAYPPGNYQIAPSSLFVGDFGRLTLGSLTLIPLQAKVQQAA